MANQSNSQSKTPSKTSVTKSGLEKRGGHASATAVPKTPTAAPQGPAPGAKKNQ